MPSWTALSQLLPGSYASLSFTLLSFSFLSVPSLVILKVPPLPALPSHWLLESLFTNQNQLGAGPLSVLHADILAIKFLGEHN